MEQGKREHGAVPFREVANGSYFYFEGEPHPCQKGGDGYRRLGEVNLWPIPPWLFVYPT